MLHLYKLNINTSGHSGGTTIPQTPQREGGDINFAY